MPGLIGKAYADMGGTVNYVGKPHPAVYQACFEALALCQVSEEVSFHLRLTSRQDNSRRFTPVVETAR